MQGEGYTLMGSSQPTTQFGFNGGKGMLKLDTGGQWDIYFEKYDEHITIMKIPLIVKNLIWGGMYVDADGVCEALNHKTGDRVELNLLAKSGKVEIGSLRGGGFDASGRQISEVSGNWLTEIRMRDLRTNQVEVLWKEKPLVPDAHLMYFYSRTSMMINDRNGQMMGMISPTDARFRKDIVLYENNEVDEADREKLLIEDEQRRKRKLMEEGVMTQRPNFFEEVPHPFLSKDSFKSKSFENAKMWKLIETDGSRKSYWDRREQGDWSGLPKLWGPFE